MESKDVDSRVSLGNTILLRLQAVSLSAAYSIYVWKTMVSVAQLTFIAVDGDSAGAVKMVWAADGDPVAGSEIFSDGNAGEQLKMKSEIVQR